MKRLDIIIEDNKTLHAMNVLQDKYGARFKHVTKRHKVKKSNLEKHHAIEVCRFLDWHLENLWSMASINCIILKDKTLHHKKHGTTMETLTGLQASQRYTQGAELISQIKSTHRELCKNLQ